MPSPLLSRRTPNSLTFAPLRLLAAVALALGTATPALAVFPFNWTTDSGGTITGGSWSGDGTVQTGVAPGTWTSGVIADIAVQQFSSGSFVIDNMGGNVFFPTNRLLTDPISATHTITLSGGPNASADLRLANTNNFDDGASFWNSIGLTNFTGDVESITWTIRFSELIAGRNDALGSAVNRPMGAALGLVNQGGAQLNHFTVGLEFSEIWSAETLGGSFSLGVPGSAVPFASGTIGPVSPGQTSFSFTEFEGYAVTANEQFGVVRGYDVTGGGYDATDAQLVYIQEMVWTITRTGGGSFTNETLFVMSMDGQQYETVYLVPEPTRALLMAVALMALCLRRRRA